MNRAVLAICTLAILLPLAPTALAVHGSPAAQVCEFAANSTASVSVSLPNEAFSANAVGSDNSFYFIMRDTAKVAPQDETDRLVKVNNNCSIAWSIASSICTDAPSNDERCNVWDVHIDHAGRVVTLTSWDENLPSGAEVSYVEIRNPVTGALIDRSLDLTTLSPALTTPQSVVSVLAGNDTLEYIVVDDTADRLVRLSANLSAVVYNVALVDVRNLECCVSFDTEEFLLGSGRSGSGNRWVKLNATTGAVAASQATAGTVLAAGNDVAPIPLYNNANLAIGAIASGTAGNVELSYRNATLSTFALSGTIDFLPNQIRVGPTLVSSITVDYDLDSNDVMLLCGVIGANAFFGQFTSASNHQNWNVTIDIDDDDSAETCALDYAGDVWVGVDYEDAGPSSMSIVVRRYSGGDFAAIAERRSTITITEEETAGPAQNIVDMFVNLLVEGWGFDVAQSGWLLGLIFIAQICIAFARISPSGIVIATGLLLGLGLTMALGLIPEWVLFVYIFILVSMAGIRLFNLAAGDVD